jgi:hypothetical protein
MKRSHAQSIRAFTLIELLMATTMGAIIGGIALRLLSAGLVLFAKNTAINMAHQQARVAVIQIERNLHASVSLPQLVDINRTAVSGNGPAAGISFQLFSGGPFVVTAAASTGQYTVQLGLGTYQPKAGQRLVIPTHHIEIDLAQDAPGSDNRNVTLVAPLPRDIAIQLDNAGTPQAASVIGFITDRVTYVTNGGNLRRYWGNNATTFTVLANDITSALPFSTPQTPAGAPYYRFVAAINLSTSEATLSNRGFKSANMYLNSQVPCRSRLCAYQ